MPLPGQVLCTAHKRKTGEPCTQVAIKGKTTCRLHGGLSLSGPTHPSYKTGRYAKHLPAQLAARAEEARTNPRLLSLSDDIAVAEARLAELMGQLGTGESGAAWRQLNIALDTFEAAMMSGEMGGMNTAFATMKALVRQGGQRAETWDEIRRVYETRCKQVQTEMKTLQGMQQMVTVQQLTLFLGAMTDACVRAVQAHADTPTSRRILRDVMSEFTALATLEEK